MTDQDTATPQPSGQPDPEADVGYGSPADTRPPEADDRRTPDDDRYGYGSEEGYEVEEGSPGASSGGGSKQPGEE
ncbi:hypothetical protein [Deinococcus aestuarii]|uniref:hypothetical protein n=1 Tax=Deinococcus aestuarii TaxID=2774531 RepID=UPI001C0B6004|nr:hypothetical protein [Deinococcus aestuarii]